MADSLSTTYTGRVVAVNEKGLRLEDHEREKARKRAHYLANREAYLARAAAQRERLGREAVRAYNEQYRARNGDRLRAKGLAYRERNRAREVERATAHQRAHQVERQEYMRRYQEQNKERLAARTAAWKRANMDLVAAYNARQRARRRGAPISDLTRKQWDAIREAYGHCCAYCGRHMVRLTMDHVVPLSRSGSHTARNIVPACRPCNARKRDRAALPIGVLPRWSDLAVVFGEVL